MTNMFEPTWRTRQSAVSGIRKDTRNPPADPSFVRLAYDLVGMTLSSLFSRRRPRKHVQALVVQNLTFTGEQDGDVERRLKAQLSEMFASSPDVITAYLARAKYGDGDERSVCLCLSSYTADQKLLFKDIQSIFAQHFGRRVHLDILFLRGQQEDQLAVVCKPFYLRSS